MPGNEAIDLIQRTITVDLFRHGIRIIHAIEWLRRSAGRMRPNEGHHPEPRPFISTLDFANGFAGRPPFNSCFGWRCGHLWHVVHLAAFAVGHLEEIKGRELIANELRIAIC